MPRFIGDFVPRPFNQTAFNELYEFNIVPPATGDYDPQAVLPAFVTPEVHDTYIAEELAQAFGGGNPGDCIELTLQEGLFDGSTAKFHLPVVVNYASRNRGSHYVQIGLSDLWEHFELKLYHKPDNPNDRFLEITRKLDSDRSCIEEPEEGSIAR